MHTSPYFIMVALAGLLSACQSPSFALERRTVDMAYVEQVAQELAGEAYDEEAGNFPEELAAIDYDAYRDIRFDAREALWVQEDLAFRVEFFHPGGLFNREVLINEFTETHQQRIRFNPSLFDYGSNEPPAARLARKLGYAGLRIRYPLNRPDVYDEVAVFLGASYFRAAGQSQVFGLSARGLAIDAGLAVDEEFPRFREFWLGKPEPGDRELVIYALLDSESVTGAYRFVLKPGRAMQLDVQGTLFFREEVERVGLAPLSSMFYVGSNSINKPSDFRPRIHDSDGVMLVPEDGPVVWHPLVNPLQSHIRTSVFEAGPLKRFGLMQRERDFEMYQDIEAAYHLRPNAWILPSDMPPGRPLLFEFSTVNEVVDNVVLMYQLDAPVAVMQPLRFAYTMEFDASDPSPAGRVKATRIGRSPWHEGIFEVVIDFEGEMLAGSAGETPLRFVHEVAGNGEIGHSTVIKNPYNDTWRVVLYFKRSGEGPVNIIGHLESSGTRLSETWSYQWVD